MIAEAFVAMADGFRSGAIRQAGVRQQAASTGGWIYYLRLGDRIKIGHTTNLSQRLAAYPPDVVLLAAHPGSRQDEGALHQLYQSYRVAGREWYGQHEPILKHIRAMIAKHGTPDALALKPIRQRRPRAQAVAVRSRSGGRSTRT